MRILSGNCSRRSQMRVLRTPEQQSGSRIVSVLSELIINNAVPMGTAYSLTANNKLYF